MEWNTNTATAALVLGSLAFLWAVKAGFKGVTVS